MIHSALRISSLIPIVATGLFAASSFADAPRIFWASDPVRPDETVLLQGSDLGAASAIVEMARLPDGAPGNPGPVPDNLPWTPVAPLQATAESLKFVVPADWKSGVFACRVKVGGKSSAAILLNAPDPSSVITIVFFNGRVLVIANRFEDANWVNAGYGTSIDVICAENHLSRCADLMNHGVRAEGHGFEPSWHVQYFDNQIAEGQTSIGSSGAGHDSVGGYQGPLTWCAVHRRHTVAADNSGSISIGGNIRDVIVEGCALSHPLSVIKVDGTAQGILFRNNHFEGGNAPRYEGAGIKAAVTEAGK